MKLIRLLQLSDSAFPTGAYAFSDGLETYTHSGRIRSGAQLQALLETQLELGWGRLDAPACALAWRAWPNAEAIEEISQHLSAIKTIEGPRLSSLRMGSTLARTVHALWPELIIAPGHHATVFGAAARALQIHLPQALTGFISAWAIGKATAATRLFSIGGLEVQKVIAGLGPVVEHTIESAQHTPLEQLGSFTPALDLAAQQHRHLPLRLFQS